MRNQVEGPKARKTPREQRLQAQQAETAKQMRDFASGAKRSSDAGKPDYLGFISHRAVKRFGEYMLAHQKCEDGSMRASDNWKKGIPIASYRSSRSRHLRELEQMEEQGAEGKIDLSEFAAEYEEALCALIFNCQGLLHEHLKATGR